MQRTSYIIKDSHSAVSRSTGGTGETLGTMEFPQKTNKQQNKTKTQFVGKIFVFW